MKYLLFFVLISIGISTFAQTKKQYRIGDSAFCGIVFYVQQLDTLGAQHLLVCSLKDQSERMHWYNGRYVNTMSVKDVLFDRDNAEQIISMQGNGTYAATLCKDFSLQDSACPVRDTTWYLPSVAELQLMFKNLDTVASLNLANEGYWSSVEFADSITSRKNRKQAWIVDFLDGKSFPVNKANKYHVRAIKAVTN